MLEVVVRQTPEVAPGNMRNAAHVNTTDVFGEHGTTEATAADVAWMPNGTGSVTAGETAFLRKQ